MAAFQPAPFSGVGVFAPSAPFEKEMARFEALRVANPRCAAMEMRRGAALVAVARSGDVEKLHVMVRSGSPPWFWFTCQMFSAAAVAGHVRVLKYMLVHGLPLDTPPLEEGLVKLAETCEAADGGAAVVDVARYLVAQGGVDVNRQRRSDWRTCLHVACARGLRDLATALVALGADVNAVARDDVMPLHCADDAPEHAKDALRALLEKKGARRTWRRQPPAAAAAAAAKPAKKPDVKAIAAEVAAMMEGMELGDNCFDTGLAAGGAMDDLVKPLAFGPVSPKNGEAP